MDTKILADCHAVLSDLLFEKAGGPRHVEALESTARALLDGLRLAEVDEALLAKAMAFDSHYTQVQFYCESPRGNEASWTKIALERTEKDWQSYLERARRAYNAVVAARAAISKAEGN